MWERTAEARLCEVSGSIFAGSNLFFGAVVVCAPLGPLDRSPVPNCRVIVMKEHTRRGRRPRRPDHEAAVRYGSRKKLRIFRRDIEDATPYNGFFALTCSAGAFRLRASQQLQQEAQVLFLTLSQGGQGRVRLPAVPGQLLQEPGLGPIAGHQVR